MDGKILVDGQILVAECTGVGGHEFLTVQLLCKCCQSSS